MSQPSAELAVRSVGFTPIKGTRHLAQSDAEFDEWGPVGDRRYCLVDIDKQRVLRTVQNPSLVGILAQFHGAELEVTLPDERSVCAAPEASGETLTCDYWGRQVEAELTRGSHDALLSSWLGEPVRLAKVPRGDVVYGQPVTLVTTASIRDLGEQVGHPDLLAEAARFRATALVDTDTPYIEETWAGREMLLGGVRVRIGEAIPRCAVIDLDPVTGERGPRVLKTLAEYRGGNDKGEPFFGVYAQVVGGAQG
ncbi:MOSC domain-containing protein [Brevibacterium sandarakinum]|uniref:MOSC domain-containing protein n=1 Tax=Brevibacterium sandarakinum TaxID=629680 RepID=UPI001E34ED99|nr:MOSC N-terminal beta barrel domain-containing protein [Brevibacterium sandarakinum]